MTKKRKTAFIVLYSLIALVVIGVFVFAIGYKKINKNITTYFDEQQLTFTEDTYEDDINKLEKWVNSIFVSDYNKGLICERLTFLYYYTGDDYNFISYRGKAQVYLEKTKNFNTLLNLYNDITSDFISYDNFSYAKKYFNYSTELYNNYYDSISPQVLSYYHRLNGILLYHEGNYEDSILEFEEANNVIDDEQGLYAPSYFAIDDIMIAKSYVALGELDKAKIILDEYSESEYLNPIMYVEMTNKSFGIPYYQTSVVYKFLAKEDYSDDLEKLVKLCSKYNYQSYGIETINYIRENGKNSKAYEKELYSLYDLSVSSHNDLYSKLVLSQIDESKYEMELEHRSYIKNLILFIFLILFNIFVIAITLIILEIRRNSMIDGLTNIPNRKALDLKLKKLNDNNEAYSFIMMDIDNFKRVNDLYGHINGDVVLRRLGVLLKHEIANGILNVYRYGGEEFSIIVQLSKPEVAYDVAEHVRSAFKDLKWDFDDRLTLSLGVAYTDGDNETVVKRADDKLYYSKKHGKDQVN